MSIFAFCLKIPSTVLRDAIVRYQNNYEMVKRVLFWC